MVGLLLLAPDTLERRLVDGLHVQEPARVGVAFDVVAGRRDSLAALLDRTNSVPVSGRVVFGHVYSICSLRAYHMLMMMMSQQQCAHKAYACGL